MSVPAANEMTHAPRCLWDWLCLYAGSAVNISGTGAVLFSLAAGSIVSAMLYGAVVIGGTMNKGIALRQRGKTRQALLFKPELTATVLMGASLLNALATALGVVAAHYGLAWLQPYVPMAFRTEIMALVFGCAWIFGAIGDYLMKLNDRRRYRAGVDAPAVPLGRNPILWFTLVSLTSNIAITDLAGATRNMWQQTFGALSVLTAGVSLAVIVIGSSRPANKTYAPRLTAQVSTISALAALLAALQLAAAGFSGTIPLFFAAQLLFMASYILIGREIHAKALITP